MTLPYVGNVMHLLLSRRLITLFKRINYHCNIKFRSYEVSNYFSLKDVNPITLRANVVHCFKGSCDKALSYICKIKSHLAVRVQEPLTVKS